MFEEKELCGTIEAAKKIGVEVHRLYCWEHHGVVSPTMKSCCTRKFRRYSRPDIERAIYVKRLVDDEGYTLSAAVRKLKEQKS